MGEEPLEIEGKNKTEALSRKPALWFVSDMVSDTGICRKVNQDACCVRIMRIAEYTLVMAAVCDGVGGLQEGDYASRSTIQSLHNWFDYTVSKSIQGKNEEQLFNFLQEEAEQCIQNQNNIIYEYAKENNIRMGTTLTLIIIVNCRYFIAQIGDSRAYCIREGLTQLTEDQSVIMQEIKAGRLSEKAAKHDKRRNVILQCIGASEELHTVYNTGEIYVGDVIFLCSDGFVHEMEDEEIQDFFCPRLLVDRLSVKKRIKDAIFEVKKRGEKDNITVVLIKAQEANKENFYGC